MAVILNRITLDDVRAAKPRMIYYGANTCWWTHDPAHLSRHPVMDLPCDPRGGMLFQTDDPEAFLKAAEERAEHYGRHGIRAFVAAHHLNCVVSAEDPRPTCLREWEEYNALLDEQEG